MAEVWGVATTAGGERGGCDHGCGGRVRAAGVAADSRADAVVCPALRRDPTSPLLSDLHRVWMLCVCLRSRKMQPAGILCNWQQASIWIRTCAEHRMQPRSAMPMHNVDLHGVWAVRVRMNPNGVLQPLT